MKPEKGDISDYMDKILENEKKINLQMSLEMERRRNYDERMKLWQLVVLLAYGIGIMGTVILLLIGVLRLVL